MSNASQTGGNHFALMSSGFAQKFRAKLFFKRRDTCQHKLGSVKAYSKKEGLTFGRRVHPSKTLLTVKLDA